MAIRHNNTDPRALKLILDYSVSYIHSNLLCERQLITFDFQVVLLSATMPDEVLEVTKRFMREPIRILVKKEELTLEGIRQFYIQVEKEVRFQSTFNPLPHEYSC